MSLVPSSDQVAGQLRQIIPAVGIIVSAFGISQAQTQSWTQIGLALVGPISIIICSVWQFIADSRKSIMASAAKPVDANTPAPQIVLPVQEKALADALPANVTSAPIASTGAK